MPPLRLLEYILAFVFTEKVPTMDRLVAAYFSLKLKEIESQMEYLDEVRYFHILYTWFSHIIVVTTGRTTLTSRTSLTAAIHCI